MKRWRIETELKKGKRNRSIRSALQRSTYVSLLGFFLLEESLSGWFSFLLFDFLFILSFFPFFFFGDGRRRRKRK